MCTTSTEQRQAVLIFRMLFSMVGDHVDYGIRNDIGLVVRRYLDTQGSHPFFERTFAPWNSAWSYRECSFLTHFVYIADDSQRNAFPSLRESRVCSRPGFTESNKVRIRIK